MKLTLKKESLEKILITNWASIFDIREVIKLIQNITSNKLECQYEFNKFTISRFELIDDYFLIWFEIECKNPKTTNTIECFYKLNGDLEFNAIF